METLEELYAAHNSDQKSRNDQIEALAKREGITPEEWTKRHEQIQKKGAMLFRPVAIELVYGETEAEDDD